MSREVTSPTVVPMSELMAEDRLYFSRGALFNQSVVYDDMLRPGKTVEVAEESGHEIKRY
jgi:hypothetical protein